MDESDRNTGFGAASAPQFWAALDELVNSSELRLDRPKGSRHPNFPDLIYPLDYGFLEATTAGDGNGIDVWSGSLGERRLVAIAVTVDLAKRDSEIKVLLDCMEAEIAIVSEFSNRGGMKAVIARRDDARG